MKQASFSPKRWRRVEYQRLADLGTFEHDSIELINGQLIVAEPKGSEHAAAVDMAYVALLSAIPAGWTVRGQNPLALDDESAPEPDLAVVHGTSADFRHAHPTRPALVVEVAESSLHYDRVTKGSLYARAGIVDYWIVNLIDRMVEVYRTPGPDLSAPFGWRYTSVDRFRGGDSVTPLDVPAAPLAVAALLP
jgi:Uma2 family endonuclease